MAYEIPKHLRNLTPKQQKFVVEYINRGGNRVTAAAAAGYSPNGIHQATSRLLSQENIKSAIKAEAEIHLQTHVAPASKVLVDLMLNGKSERIKLQAATEVLDRGGLPFIRQSEHRHFVEDSRTDDELRQVINERLRELGLDAEIVEGSAERIEAPAEKPTT